MSDNLDLIIALARVKSYDQFSQFPTVGNINAVYIDRANNRMYRWTGSAYVQITGGALNFKGTFNALTNTPTLSSGSGAVGDFYLVSVANGNITYPLDGITNLQLDDQIIAQPKIGGGTQWVRIPSQLSVIPPIEISTSQTLTTLNATYLVTANSNLTLTIPTPDLNNQSRYIRVIKVAGTGSITVIPTSGQKFVGDDQSVLMRSSGDVVTVQSSGQTAIGWSVIDKTLNDILIEEVEILKSGNTAPNQDQNWKVIITADGLLSFDRREGGVWVEKQTLGDSVHTDILYTSGVQGGLKYEDTGGRIIEVIRLSPNGTIWSLGDETLTASVVSDVAPLVITEQSPTPVTVTVNDVMNSTATTTQLTFNFTSVDGGRIESLLINTGGIDSARIVVTEVTNNVVIYETCTAFDFINNNGGVTIPSGAITLPLLKVARIRANLLYRVDVFCKTASLFNGTGVFGTNFVPFLKYDLIKVYFDYMMSSRNMLAGQGMIKTIDDVNRTATISRKTDVQTISTNLTINSSNVNTYKFSTIIVTQDGNSNITLSPSIFSVGDTLTIKNWSGTGVSANTVILQQSGTIDGENDILVEKGKAVTIQYVAVNTWRIISTYTIDTYYNSPQIFDLNMGLPSLTTSYSQLQGTFIGTVTLINRPNVAGNLLLTASNGVTIGNVTPQNGVFTFSYTITPTQTNTWQTNNTNPIVFTLSGVDTKGFAFSTTFSQLVQTVPDSGKIYYGYSTVNTNITPTALSDNFIIVNDQKDYIDYQFPTTTGNKYVVMACPNTLTPSLISIDGLNSLSAFNVDSIHPVIGSTTYDVYVSVNQVNINNADFRIHFL